MQLKHCKTRRRLLKGDVDVVIRTMTRADIPAMRRLDDEVAAEIDFANAQRAPGNESGVGGPWSSDEWLVEHFEQYASRGNITLLAENDEGKLIGFADLWAADEPEPFGRSLTAQCIDFLWEYYHLGFETIFLEQAERVARSAGLPALDTGTNGSSGCYQSLRAFGLKVFYEYDAVVCRCDARAQCPDFRIVPVDQADTSGLIKICHWSASDFDYAGEPGRPGIHEFAVDGQRVLADFYRLWEPGHTSPIDCELFAAPAVLTSPELMNRILSAAAAIAGKERARQIPLPCPSEIPLNETALDIVRRDFRFAWMRKTLVR